MLKDWLNLYLGYNMFDILATVFLAVLIIFAIVFLTTWIRGL